MTGKNHDATIFVGVYGTLRTPNISDVDGSLPDAYSMLRMRSAALGYSLDGGTRPSPEGWAIHDAGEDWQQNESGNRLAWFQVGLDENRAAGTRNLPIPGLLRCVQDVVDRAGDTEVDSVQLLLPIQCGGFDLTELASTREWFDAGPKSLATTSAWVTLDAGNDRPLNDLAESLSDALDTADTGPFTLRVEPGAPIVDPQPRLASEVWVDAGHHGVTLEAQLPEWSLDAIGWATAALAEVLNRMKVETTVLVSWRLAN